MSSLNNAFVDMNLGHFSPLGHTFHQCALVGIASPSRSQDLEFHSLPGGYINQFGYQEQILFERSSAVYTDPAHNFAIGESSCFRPRWSVLTVAAI